MSTTHQIHPSAAELARLRLAFVVPATLANPMSGLRRAGHQERKPQDSARMLTKS